MDITLYQQLTGTTVAASQLTLVTAKINRTKYALERMLGYSLDATTGTSVRRFSYFHHDEYLLIDPTLSITSIKLVRGDEVVHTFTADEFKIYKESGYIKYISRCYEDKWCICVNTCYSCAQLVVDAVWLWDDGDIPVELLYAWADMISYEADNKNNIKSETLATHRYEKFSNNDPLMDEEILHVIRKYAGGNGSIVKTIII